MPDIVFCVGRLARAVRAEQRDDLTLVDRGR